MEKGTLLVKCHQLRVTERLQGLQMALMRSSLKALVVLVTDFLKTLESKMELLRVEMNERAVCQGELAQASPEAGSHLLAAVVQAEFEHGYV